MSAITSLSESTAFLNALDDFSKSTEKRIKLQTDATQHQFHSTWYYLERLLELKTDLSPAQQKEKIIDSSFFTYEISSLVHPFTNRSLSSLRAATILETYYFCAFFLEYRNPNHKQDQEKSTLGNICLGILESFLRAAQSKEWIEDIENLKRLKKSRGRDLSETKNVLKRIQERAISKDHLHLLVYILTHEREKILSVDFQFEKQKMISTIETRPHGRLRLVQTLLSILSSGKLSQCPFCKKLFLGKTSKTRYCSKSHATRASKKK